MNWTAINVIFSSNMYEFQSNFANWKCDCDNIIRLFVNVCKFMLCIASWKLERLIAQ